MCFKSVGDGEPTEAMMNGQRLTVESALPLSAWLVGIVVAFSSFVRIEPAPYDLLMILLCAVFFMAGLRVPARLGVPLFVMTLFVVANLLSIFGAMARNVNDIVPMAVYAGTTIYLIIAWLFFTCFVSQRPRTGIRAIWNGYVFAAIVAALLGIGGYFGLIPGSDAFADIGRANGPFKDPNLFGPFLVPPLLYVVAQAVGRPLIPALVRYSLSLVLGLGIFLSFSRGSWLNLGIAVCTFAFLHVLISRSTRQVIAFALKGLGILVLTAGVFVAITLTSPSVRNMLQVRAAVVHNYDVQPGGRFDTQRIAIRAVWSHPLGIGPAQRVEGQGQDPHNLYVKVALENGWLGILAFILFIFLTLWRGLRICTRSSKLQRSHIVVMSCLLALAIQSFLIDTLHWRHFFLLLGMAWGVILAGESRVSVRTSIDARITNKSGEYGDASAVRSNVQPFG